jgi:ATP-binding cassette subfamily F protein 3
MGMEAPTSGRVQLGHNVIPEYFAQDQYKVLDPAARMLDDISRAAIKVPELALRSLLGCFLFSGDDVFKPLGVLSGGERNRFALARILVSPSNFLLLDEPTNHLDMRAKDVLLEAIESFTGTVIFVSHDRYFLDRLATKVLEVKDGGVVIYPGNFAEYVRDKEEQEARGAGAQDKLPAPIIEKPVASSHGSANGSAPALFGEAASSPDNSVNSGKDKIKRLNPIKLKQLEERCAFLEEEVPRLEASISHTEGALGNYVSASETERQTRLLEELRRQLTDSTAEWEELMMQLEEQSALS